MQADPACRREIIEFCVTALDYLHAPEREIEQLVSVVSCWGAAQPDSVQIFNRILNSLNPRDLGLTTGLARGIVNALRTPDIDGSAVSRACDLLYQLKLLIIRRKG